MYAPHRSECLAGRSVPPNFNLSTIGTNKISKICSEDVSLSPDDVFFIAGCVSDNDSDNFNACSINLNDFQREYKGGVCIFQQVLDKPHTSFDVDLFNLLSSKHSLRDTVERFNMT